MNTSLKKVVHHFFSPHSHLYFHLWVNFYWRPKKNSIEAFLNQVSKQHPNLFFLQIGSNDGFHGDPLYKFIRRDGWGGIMVEPLPFLFKSLKENYQKFKSKNQIHFENIAISDENSEKKFYFVKPFKPSKKLPLFLNQQGSFNAEHLRKVKKLYPRVEICFQKVPCRTVKYLLEKHHPKNIDLIHIDTEGHDFTILKSLNLEAIQPKMVLYEHRHMTSFQQLEIENLFSKHGYQIKKETYDTLVYNFSVGKVDYEKLGQQLEMVEFLKN